MNGIFLSLACFGIAACMGFLLFSPAENPSASLLRRHVEAFAMPSVATERKNMIRLRGSIEKIERDGSSMLILLPSPENEKGIRMRVLLEKASVWEMYAVEQPSSPSSPSQVTLEYRKKTVEDLEPGIPVSVTTRAGNPLEAIYLIVRDTRNPLLLL